jgi:hypothetical protein
MSLDNLDIFLGFSRGTENSFPEVLPIFSGDILGNCLGFFPEQAVQFNVGHPERYSACVGHFFVGHFFLDDNMFERVWRSPARYVEKLRHFAFLAAPDFSLFSNTPLLLQRMSVYRSRLLTRFFQECGLLVVPVIQYSSNFSWQDVCSEFPLPAKGTALCVRLPGVCHSAYEHELLLKNLETLDENQELIVFVPSGYRRTSSFFEELNSFTLELFFVDIKRKFEKNSSLIF